MANWTVVLLFLVWRSVLGFGSGSVSGSGKVKGEYNGRVLGEEYKFLHLVFEDNSYHVVDVSRKGK